MTKNARSPSGTVITVIDVLLECDAWAGALPGHAALAEKTARTALKAAGVNGPVELSIVFADDAMIRRLNRDYRDKDRPTNVLSFPVDDAPSDLAEMISLGDVVLGFETVRKEAEAAGKTLDDHVTHLVVHGILHLLGYDHEMKDQAEEMEGLEIAILKTLDVADPYDAEADGPAEKGIKEAQA